LDGRREGGPLRPVVLAECGGWCCHASSRRPSNPAASSRKDAQQAQQRGGVTSAPPTRHPAYNKRGSKPTRQQRAAGGAAPGELPVCPRVATLKPSVGGASRGAASNWSCTAGARQDRASGRATAAGRSGRRAGKPAVWAGENWAAQAPGPGRTARGSGKQQGSNYSKHGPRGGTRVTA